MFDKEQLASVMMLINGKLDLDLSIGESSYHINLELHDGSLTVNEINHEKVDMSNPEHAKEVADIFANFSAGMQDGLNALQKFGIVEPDDESDEDDAE